MYQVESLKISSKFAKVRSRGHRVIVVMISVFDFTLMMSSQ